MCEVLDKAIERGKVEGQVIGMVKAYAEMNFSVEEIAIKTSLSAEEVERILENGRIAKGSRPY